MKMDRSNTALVVILLAIGLCNKLNQTSAQAVAPPLVSAIVFFGDSIVDVGNNNFLPTLFKADFLPYGRDFDGHGPTGRFSNGKLAVDFLADMVGFNNYPLPYLNPRASNGRLVDGVNFASAASGYDIQTSIFNHAISMQQQLEYYKEYQGKLANIVGMDSARAIRNDTLFIIGAGSSDFLLNYYVNPVVNIIHTPLQYSTYLVDTFSKFVKELYRLGARRIGVTSLPPMGCLPLSVTLFGFGKSGCVEEKNIDAQDFNMKMNETIERLKIRLPGLKMELFDIYTPIYELVQNPYNHGFLESRRGCCGTGRIETTTVLCNMISLGTCGNASNYVFWDSVHPTEAANHFIVNSLQSQGMRLVLD